MKILIIQQKMIGDVLLSSILFENLREKCQSAELHYLINSHTLPVVENNPFIDTFILLTPEIEKSYLSFLHFLIKIRTEQFDVIIDVYGKISSYMMTLFSGSKKKIGYHKSYSSLLFTNTIKRRQFPELNSSLAIENRLRLLEPLDIQLKATTPKIYLTKEEQLEADAQLENSGIDLKRPLLMISVLGSAKNKTYPAAYMAQLLNKVVTILPNVQLIFNYVSKQKLEAREIYNLTTKTTQEHIFFDLYGKSIREFLAITSRCTALIGNEGGATNMSQALNKPTFVIFSPQINKKNWFGGYNTEKHIAVHLSDFMHHNRDQEEQAKKNPLPYYLKMKPSLIEPRLIEFLQRL